jgi:F-type H+-transporting ATPase subunit b
MAFSTLARANKCTVARTVRAAAPRAAVRIVAKAQNAEKSEVSQIAKPAFVAAVANIIMALPAAAEPGKLFDFDLTLPIIAGEFLLLMVFLDKAWFGPVGKVLDDRDNAIRERLAAVKGDTAELEELTMQAEKVLKDARAEVSAMIQKQKSEKQAELDKIYNAAKASVTKETESAIAALEKESTALLASMDAQVDKISADFLARLLPQGIKV